MKVSLELTWKFFQIFEENIIIKNSISNRNHWMEYHNFLKGFLFKCYFQGLRDQFSFFIFQFLVFYEGRKRRRRNYTLNDACQESIQAESVKEQIFTFWDRVPIGFWTHNQSNEMLSFWKTYFLCRIDLRLIRIDHFFLLVNFENHAPFIVCLWIFFFFRRRRFKTGIFLLFDSF